MTNDPSSRAIAGHVRVDFHYRVHFTSGLFSPDNPLFHDVLTGRVDGGEGRGERPAGHARGPVRVLFVVDEEVERCHGVRAAVERYLAPLDKRLALAGAPVLLPGGEAVKNDPRHVETLQRAVSETGLDRHSYLAAVGGGALLDAAGFAAATAHRGIRLIRVPTTTLSQADSGVGVKNGINAFGKKNFVGTFAPAWAVLNDARWLPTLPLDEWRNGIAEAVKVALVQDAAFFGLLEQSAPALAARGEAAMGALIHRCAELHVRHICRGGDPFETGSSRPLDFGHWSAHRLEQMTGYGIPHGAAVALGIALDATYSHLQGWLPEGAWRRTLDLLAGVGFALWAGELERHMDEPAHPESIFGGLGEFREHLGGPLTIQMLAGIGAGFNVHEINEAVMARAIRLLQSEAQARTDLSR